MEASVSGPSSPLDVPLSDYQGNVHIENVTVPKAQMPTGGDAVDAAFITEPGIESVDALKATVAGTTESNQATLLLKKRKDMRMVDESLEKVKREFKERMELLAERQLKFEEKQRALSEMVAKFKPFIEENDNKRSRAIAKAAAEAAAKVRLEAEIEKFTADLATGRAEKDSVEDLITRLKKSARYLEDVVSAAAQGNAGVAEVFANANDILARYGELKTTNTALHEQANSAATQLERLRADVMANAKRLKDMSLVSTAGTQELRTRLEAVRAEVSDMTSRREFAEADVRRTRAVAGQTEVSIKNIYARVMATAPVNSLPKVVLDKSHPNGNFLFLAEALDVIGDRIQDLDAIVAGYAGWKVTRETSGVATAAGSGVAAVRAAAAKSHAPHQTDGSATSSAQAQEKSGGIHGSVASLLPTNTSSTVRKARQSAPSDLGPSSSYSNDLMSTSMGADPHVALATTERNIFRVGIDLPSLAASPAKTVYASYSTTVGVSPIHKTRKSKH